MRRLWLSRLAALGVVWSTACDAPSPHGPVSPGALGPVPPPNTLSGQVTELVPGGRVPVSNIPVHVAVVTGGACSPPCASTRTWTYHSAATGPDGRYHFANLPAGAAKVQIWSANLQQVCGATAVLGPATELNLEITSRANPQRSESPAPLRITGQIYEMTSAGRVGLAGAGIGLEWIAPDSPFVDFSTDKDGRYTACGIPAFTQMAFWIVEAGYREHYEWHSFAADATLDIELKRR